MRGWGWACVHLDSRTNAVVSSPRNAIACFSTHNLLATGATSGSATAKDFLEGSSGAQCALEIDHFEGGASQPRVNACAHEVRTKV